MIRVALETATRLGTVAVGGDHRVLAEVELGVQTRHAEGLIPALDEALHRAGVDREDIGEVVVGAGPGSFTGVRVAGSSAKGMAAALGVPLRAYSSLLALAAGDAADTRDAGEGEPTRLRPVCALFDARRGEVYAGCWRVGEALEEILAPTVGPVEAVVGQLATVLEGRGVADAEGPMDPTGLRFVGAGAEAYRDALEAALADYGFRAVIDTEGRPRASSLLRLAHRYPEAGAVETIRSWEPTYVRGSSAERGVEG